MPDKDKENFPVCRYSASSKTYHGIYINKDEFKKHYNTFERLIYKSKNNQFVIYCWNIFSTLLFVQECLKRFGKPGDQFILIYCDKDDKELEQNEKYVAMQKDFIQQANNYKIPLSTTLINSKNLILRGAPGTGKTYLARQIAADIISHGETQDPEELTGDQKKQMEFVQFHPSYDYSDFVEGLRPILNEEKRKDSSISFELKPGIFKRFVDRAGKNYENAHKSKETLEREAAVQEAMTNFFESCESEANTFKTKRGKKFTITVDGKSLSIDIEKNPISNELSLNVDDIRKMLESDVEFKNVKDIRKFLKRTYPTQADSYYFAIYDFIREKYSLPHGKPVEREEEKEYIFIIDEINRGEISKIFGELFFSIDPGYRGKDGSVSTQYSNDSDEKFYIPKNVYLIGTMNDIDRSVDSFDFAMRRRFRFVELKAEDRLEMLDSLEDGDPKNEGLKKKASDRMKALNDEITNTEGLNENYHIGPAYFLKLKFLPDDTRWDKLWEDHLEPLLRDYVQGMPDEKELMKKFDEAYKNQKVNVKNSDNVKNTDSSGTDQEKEKTDEGSHDTGQH